MRLHTPFFAILTIAALACSGCGSSDSARLGPEEYRSATGATATVRIVADDRDLADTLPDHGDILGSIATNLENALQMEQAEPEALGAPLVTPDALAADSRQAAVDADQEAQKRDDAVDKEQERSWFDKVLSWGGWVTVGGGVLWLARLAGVPGVQFLSDPLVRRLGKKWIEPMEQAQADAQSHIRDLSMTVESSLVGRAGLRTLDRLLPDNLRDELIPRIKQISGGEAESVEDLFRWLAQARSIDAGSGRAVASIVDEIKDLMPGELGALADDLLTKSTATTAQLAQG